MSAPEPGQAASSSLPEPLITFVFKSGGYQFLLRYAQRQGVSDEVAEDLVQETLIRALQHYDSLSDKSTLSEWLVTILHSQLIEHTRRSASVQRSESTLTDEAWEFLAETVPNEDRAERLTEDKQLWAANESAFKRFQKDHPKLATVLLYSIAEGLTLSELAGRLGWTERVTRVFLSEARKKARSYFSHAISNTEGAQ